MGVGLIGPAQELRERAHLFLGDLEMRHLAAAFDARRLRLHPSVEDFIGGFRVIGALLFIYSLVVVRKREVIQPGPAQSVAGE